MKKATIKPATEAQILKSLGISKKRQAEVLAIYAAAKKKLSVRALKRHNAQAEAATT